MENTVDTQKFPEIWSRVTSVDAVPASSEVAPERDEDGTLRSLLDREAHGLARYRALSARFPHGAQGGTFRQLVQDEISCIRQLQLRYYLLVGDSYTPPRMGPESALPLTALRAAYAGETEKASLYREAAVRTRDGKLQTLYADLSDRALRRAERLESALSAAMR